MTETIPSDLPPPYTPHDPNGPPSPVAPTSPSATPPPPDDSLGPRAGYLQQRSGDESSLTSPSAFFEERSYNPCDVPQLIIVERDIHPATTRDELALPLTPQDREARDFTDQDWATFVNFLLAELNQRQWASDGGKDQHWGGMTAEEFFQCKLRMEDVVITWNSEFFMPRGIHFNAKFSFQSPNAAVPFDLPQTNRAIPAEQNLPDGQPPSADHAAVPLLPQEEALGPPLPTEHGPGSPMGPAWANMPPHMRGPGPFPPQHHNYWSPRGPPGAWERPGLPWRGHGGPMRGSGFLHGIGPGGQHSQRQPRHSRSSSSSSSSSSESSIGSVSDGDLSDADLDQMRQSLARFRLDPNKRSNMRTAVKELNRELKDARRCGDGRKRGASKEAKAEWKADRVALRGELRQINTTIRQFKRERKAERRASKNERRADKRATREARRAMRRARLDGDHTEERVRREVGRHMQRMDRGASEEPVGTAAVDRGVAFADLLAEHQQHDEQQSQLPADPPAYEGATLVPLVDVKTPLTPPPEGASGDESDDGDEAADARSMPHSMHSMPLDLRPAERPAESLLPKGFAVPEVGSRQISLKGLSKQDARLEKHARVFDQHEAHWARTVAHYDSQLLYWSRVLRASEASMAETAAVRDEKMRQQMEQAAGDEGRINRLERERRKAAEKTEKTLAKWRASREKMGAKLCAQMDKALIKVHEAKAKAAESRAKMQYQPQLDEPESSSAGAARGGAERGGAGRGRGGLAFPFGGYPGPHGLVGPMGFPGPHRFQGRPALHAPPGRAMYAGLQGPANRSGHFEGVGDYIERLGRRVDEWGEEFGRNMEAWGEHVGQDMEARGNSLGKRVETWGSRVSR